MKSKIVALSKNEEFKTLLKQKKISNKYVTIFFGNLPNKDKKKLNISFSVKKKIAIAVKRNKIKRRLRQIFNDGIKSFHFTIIFINRESWQFIFIFCTINHSRMLSECITKVFFNKIFLIQRI